MPRGRTTTVLLALLLLCGGILARSGVGPGTATAARGGTVTDPDDVPGRLDLRKAGLKQRAGRLQVTLRARDSIALRRLDPAPGVAPGVAGRYLCLGFGSPEKSARNICFGTRGKRRTLVLTRIRAGAARSMRAIRGARITRPNPNSVRGTFRFKRAGLSPGKLRWRAFSSSEGGPCEPHSGGGLPCVDLAPDRGRRLLKLVKPYRVGCRAKGAKVKRNGSRERKLVSLTFDDGPSAYTKAVMKELERKRAVGTFYVIGSQIDRDPGLLRRMLKHGHSIGNHSWAHENLPGRGSMRAVNKEVERATGFKPCLFRPPGGAINASVANAARDLGMTSVIWDVDPVDWSTPGSGTIRNRVVSAVRPGSIVLMHDGGGNRSQTVAAVSGIVKDLKKRGYKTVTTERLLRHRPRMGP